MTETPFEPRISGQPIVYVREIQPDELPPEMKGVPSPLYAVHDAEGNRLAIAADRKVAFALALKHDMVPVSVH